jgi:thiol-disulfide isomerase/thioredoxin
MSRARVAVTAAIALWLTAPAARAQGPFAHASPQGQELIGRTAPPLDLTWVDRRPELRGQVTLVRWFTGGCPYCERTLPYLSRLAAAYRGRLLVVGAYHPKPRPLPPAEVPDRLVRETAAAIGLSGAVLARDPQWTTLSRWWLDGRERAFTSVSFLVDGQGRIRWVHAGGEYHPAPASDEDHAGCREAALALEATLAGLLGPPAAARAP